jgi:hypothetical protein
MVYHDDGPHEAAIEPSTARPQDGCAHLRVRDAIPHLYETKHSEES